MRPLEFIEIGSERPDLTFQIGDLLLPVGSISIIGLQQLLQMKNLR